MQIISITNYFFLLLVGVHKASNTSILVQIPTELTVRSLVSFMSCWAIQIMQRPSSNLLQRYFSIQIFLILLAVKWGYRHATIPWKRQPTGGGYEYIVDSHGGTRTGQKSGVGERVGGLGAEFGILVVAGCSLAATAGLLLSWTL
jgi:hypothetical protein